MINSPIEIVLSEWETRGPEQERSLVGQFLDTTPHERMRIAQLAKDRKLQLTELRHGLRITSYAYVGRIQLGQLTVTIRPKIDHPTMLNLVRYAYQLRQLTLWDDTTLHTADHGIADLFIRQLVAEVSELIARGLHRVYWPVDERLGSPKGRIDFTQLARDTGTIHATLPCRHHPRTEDTLLNQVLSAGLRFATTVTNDPPLRREVQRLARVLDESVTQVLLNEQTLARATHQINRLTKAYEPALSIIDLLYHGQRVTLDHTPQTTPLRGFLFDMNRFFQTLISRFLHDHLTGYTVDDERGLKGMFRYDPAYNPHHRNAPTLRPDYTVVQGGKIQALLDAKYRDLWQKSLPREMLYQLAIYAVSERSQSAILYPTIDPHATESRINILDPWRRTSLGQVCLRPIHLPTLDRLISASGPAAEQEATSCARLWAFGQRVP